MPTPGVPICAGNSPRVPGSADEAPPEEPSQATRHVKRTAPKSVVLIAGTGRSGTTWLGKLMDASPRVLYRHEPDNWTRVPWFKDVPSRVDPIPKNDVYKEPFERGVERCLWTHCLYYVYPPSFRKDFQRNGLFGGVNLGLRAMRRLGLGDGPILEVPRFAFRQEPDQIHLVMKSVISNLRLAWIHQHFPHYRLVLIIRHPGGYLSSWLRGNPKGNFKGFGQRSRLDDTLLPFPRPELERYADSYANGTDFEREMIYWIVANETPLLALGDSPALKVVVYEQLCEAPERVLREVYEHCRIPFEDSTQRFLRASTSEHQEGYHAVFKDPKRVAWQWREEIAAPERETIERYLAGSMLAKLWA